MAVKIRYRKLKNGTKTIYLDIYDGEDNRTVESLPLRLTGDRIADRETMKLAETIRLKKELELATTGSGLRLPKTKDVNFIEYFRSLIKEKTTQTAKTWTNTLNYLVKFAGNELLLSEINKDFAERFQKSLITKNLSRNSANIYFSKFKAALNQALKDELIQINPIAQVANIRKTDTNREYLTIEELRLLSEAHCGNAEVRRAFLFACYTGLRLSDIKKLKGSNVKADTLQFRQQKTKAIQYLPLSAQAKKILDKTVPDPELVFTLPNDARILIVLKNWAKKAKITKNISFHVSRHTFATLALTYGADLYTVSKLLGHTDLKHTQIYAKIVDEKKSAAVGSIPEL